MSFLKKIAGAFVEVQDKPVKPTPKQVASQPIPQPTYVPETTNVPVGSSVKEFTDHFKQVLKEENEKNFPGNDYFEFKLVKDGLSSIPEPQRYQVAFSGLAAAGLTKDKLVSTAQRYKEIVEREMSEFNNAFDAMCAEQVTKPQQQAEEKAKKISELSTQIAQLSNEVTELKSQALSNSQKLSDKKNGFILAGTAQKDEIEGEITNINQYIQ